MSNLIKNNGNLFPSVLSDFFGADKFFNNPWLEKELERTPPAVNIKETNKEFDIEFAAPGFEKKDFNVKVEDNAMTVSAVKKNESKEENERFTRKEFSSSSFSRSFTLPQNANTDKIDAKYVDGILKLIVLKKEDTKASNKKEIKVS